MACLIVLLRGIASLLSFAVGDVASVTPDLANEYDLELEPCSFSTTPRVPFHLREVACKWRKTGHNTVGGRETPFQQGWHLARIPGGAAKQTPAISDAQRTVEHFVQAHVHSVSFCSETVRRCSRSRIFDESENVGAHLWE